MLVFQKFSTFTILICTYLLRLIFCVCCERLSTAGEYGAGEGLFGAEPNGFGAVL